MANIVFDAMAQHAIAEFGDDSSVKIVFEAQTIKLIFKGAVLARFKKGDENNLGQNIATQAALAFVDVDGELPGLPPRTAKVEFIWVANDLQTQLEKVLVVARNNDKTIWDYKIEPSGEKVGVIVEFPEQASVLSDENDDLGVENLIKPKVPSAEEEVEE